MIGQLAGRWVLVTGGMRGIGLAVAESFAEAGAALVVQDLTNHGNQEEIEIRLRSAGTPELEFELFDLRDPELTSRRFQDIASRHDIDILVNNAGVQFTASIEELDRATWDAVLSVNLSAAFESMRRFMPGMRDRGFGRVINVASVHGLVGSPDKSAYVAAKHGLVGLTRVAALEYADAGTASSGGVTVNAVCPGWSETALIEPQVHAAASAVGGEREAGIATLLGAKQPTKRFTHPNEIAALIRVLSLREFHNVTGAVIPIDGGWTAQ